MASWSEKTMREFASEVVAPFFSECVVVVSFFFFFFFFAEEQVP